MNFKEIVEEERKIEEYIATLTKLQKQEFKRKVIREKCNIIGTIVDIDDEIEIHVPHETVSYSYHTIYITFSKEDDELKQKLLKFAKNQKVSFTMFYTGSSKKSSGYDQWTVYHGELDGNNIQSY